MNMKYTEIPHYEEIDVVAKTIDTVTGTIDRKVIGRCLITEAAGFEAKHMVVGGDETPILTVAKIEEDKPVELFIELVGGVRSLASYKFFGGWTAKNRENADVTDLFTDNGEQICKLVGCAARMTEAHPECDGQWKIVDRDGNRWFVRTVAKSLSKTGRVD